MAATGIKARSALTLAALGIVFGDIGTSPLYAFRQCFHNGLNLAPTRENVLGIISLILWSLIIIVCIRYISMIMRIDHDGEGGILALLALVLPNSKRGVPPRATWLTFLILVGAGMLFGDGVITPAVSVLSAVEGLSVATSAAQPYVIPITVGILIALFAFQSRGSQRIGTIFGPVMLLWFGMIALLGVRGLIGNPGVFAAINPIHIVRFLGSNGVSGLIVLGAVVLCISGVEALYADMSHFGRMPIARAWYAIVFPALVLNYVGQGALVLTDPKALDAPFFALVPQWGTYIVVAVATAATIIASQALISGAFTLVTQAIQLGYVPRLKVVHTSQEHAGQIYVPALNVALAVVCIALVVYFQSSERLANAYGLAVAVTMVITEIGYFVVVRDKFKWQLSKALALTVPFLLIELFYVGGSIPKIPAGGWIPIAISAVLFAIAAAWRTGRRRVTSSLVEQSIPLEDFLKVVRSAGSAKIEGTAVFMTGDSEGVPFALRHDWARTHAVHERVVLLTFVPATEPFVPEAQRVTVERLTPRLLRVKARFGFMEEPNIAPIVAACATQDLHLDDHRTTYYTADPQIVPRDKNIVRAVVRFLYIFLWRNTRRITDNLGIKADQLAKLGLEVPM
ncbi:MAG: KUP/HAK/KT family potassium transporter [Candidatus Eremiobacteraeota bacterium]|nr:KUP/HAK/KT family potassium transporter [Candidatus Eremiobacteraeota bacterium]